MSTPTAQQSAALARPVVLTLYRHLLRLSTVYGRVAEQSRQTVKSEIERMTATDRSALAAQMRRRSSMTGSGDDGDGRTMAAISIAPGLMIAFPTSSSQSSSQSQSANHTSERISTEQPFPSLSASFTLTGTEIMTPTIARRIVREQFQQPSELPQQKLIGQGFLALRKLKDRLNTFTSHTASPLFASSESPSTTISVSSDGDLSVMKTRTDEPSLASLTSNVTTESNDVSVQIKTHYHRLMPSLKSFTAALTQSPSQPQSAMPHYVYKYQLVITNKHPSRTIQLLSRQWNFTDSKGQCQRVRGTGVVGRQPLLIPRQSFTYESQVNLSESKGRMEGSFTFNVIEDTDHTAKLKSGEKFDVSVGPVLLEASASTLGKEDNQSTVET